MFRTVNELLARAGSVAVKGIGYLTKSDFVEKWSTPRQSMCSEVTRATIQLYDSQSWNAIEDVLTAANPNDYIWVLFVFHKNGTTANRPHGEKYSSFKPKIRVPKRDSGTIGCFATRSPHRPNPIGLSLCRYLCSNKDQLQITINGIDMILGTPIINVMANKPCFRKPSILPYLEVSNSGANFPLWVTKTLEEKLDVLISLSCCIHLRSLGYNSTESDRLLMLATEVLALDPRSRWSRQAHSNGLFAHKINSDLLVVYHFQPPKSVNLIAIWSSNHLPSLIQSIYDKKMISASSEVLPITDCSLRSGPFVSTLADFFQILNLELDLEND